jgi:hypothetical protein
LKTMTWQHVIGSLRFKSCALDETNHPVFKMLPCTSSVHHTESFCFDFIFFCWPMRRLGFSAQNCYSHPLFFYFPSLFAPPCNMIFFILFYLFYFFEFFFILIISLAFINW